MSVSFGFYNSFEGDRTYDAIQMSSIFDGVIGDGVFATVGDAFAITVISGNTLGVGTGRAWFDHTWTLNDSRLALELGPSELLDDRIDAIVLEVNELIRANRIFVLEGEPSSTFPYRPSLIRNDKVHQYPIAFVYRTAGSSEITQADITNMIGTANTPFVTGLIDTIDTDILLAQWEAQFNAWFEEVKGSIDEDEALHLQNQIGNLSNLSTETKTNLVSAINETLENGGGTVDFEEIIDIDTPSDVLPVGYGGTGASTASEARVNLGITPSNLGFDNYIKMMSFNTASQTFSISGNGTTWCDVTIPAQAGYTPIGIVGYYLGGSVGYVCNLYYIRITNSTTIGTAWSNRTGASGTVGLTNIDILYVKNL